MRSRWAACGRRVLYIALKKKKSFPAFAANSGSVLTAGASRGSPRSRLPQTEVEEVILDRAPTVCSALASATSEREPGS